jgi:hypothetical protein
MDVILLLSGSGSKLIVGTAHISSTMLIQNGSHMFLLMVKEASVGPRKDTTYDVELIYEK